MKLVHIMTVDQEIRNEMKNKTGYSPEGLNLSVRFASLTWFLQLPKSMPRAPEQVFKLESVEDISCSGYNTCPIDLMFLIMSNSFSPTLTVPQSLYSPDIGEKPKVVSETRGKLF